MNFFVLFLLITSGPDNDKTLIEREFYSIGHLKIQKTPLNTIYNPYKSKSSSHTVVYAKEDGTDVKKGELILEVDSSYTKREIEITRSELENARLLHRKAENELLRHNLNKEIFSRQYEHSIKKLNMQLGKFNEIEVTTRLLDLNATIGIRENDLAVAKQNYEMSKVLVKKDLIHEVEVEKAFNEFVKAENELKKAKDELKQYQMYDVPKRRFELEEGIKKAEEQLRLSNMLYDTLIKQANVDLEYRYVNVERWTEQLDALENDLKNSRVYAISSGQLEYQNPDIKRGFTINRWMKEIGTIKSVDKEQIYLEVNLWPPDHASIDSDAQVEIRFLCNPEKALSGRVSYISSGGRSAPESGLDPNIRGMVVHCKLEEPPDWLRLGMRGVVVFNSAISPDYIEERTPITPGK